MPVEDAADDGADYDVLGYLGAGVAFVARVGEVGAVEEGQEGAGEGAGGSGGGGQGGGRAGGESDESCGREGGGPEGLGELRGSLDVSRAEGLLEVAVVARAGHASRDFDDEVCRVRPGVVNVTEALEVRGSR